MTTTSQAPPGAGAVKDRLETLASADRADEAATLLGAVQSRLFTQRWADLRRAIEVRDGIWDGSIHWSQRYSLDELRGYGDHQECAMDQSQADVGWALDDLIALSGDAR